MTKISYARYRFPVALAPAHAPIKSPTGPARPQRRIGRGFGVKRVHGIASSNRSSHFQAICRTAAHSAEERTRCPPTRRAVALACSPTVGGRRVQRSTFRTIRLKPPREKQYDEYDQDDADYTDAAVTVTISVATKATAETTKQEDDKEDDEYESD